MNEVTKLIQRFEACNDWVSELENWSDDAFFQPIQPGKWSTAEIISHITYWDRYLLEELIPQMKQDAKLTNPAFEVINQPAAAYALSGVSKTQLIHEQLETRRLLIAYLREKSEEDFFATFHLNGEEIDVYSGNPHSLFNYISGFIGHDNHHKQQIDAFLAS
ncbi:DinB family protein [Gracilibacillus phocaeensis]|uniref:DinB family protein n=1 Tax=Gracilibacillus phocaeensis TaxID=2042304 RepID=UPI001031CF3C|nr:DinB family protein [Gracilibacillus phocaeensis]